MASNILVRDIMVKDVRKVRNDTSAQEVVATMTKYDVSAIIVEHSRKPQGIITTHDILARMVEQCLAPKTVVARDIFTSPLITIDESATVQEAAKTMLNKKIKHLPVVKDEKLVGMVTYKEIAFKVPALLSMMEELCHSS